MSTALQHLDTLIPGNDIDAYIRTVGRIDILSLKEEKVLAEQLYYENNLEAARHLVLSHLRFVVHIAKSYGGYGLAIADLIQEGNVGLMKAVKRFNPEVGVRLVSFAVHWIKAEIHEFILKNWRIVKIATTKAQRKLFFNLRKAKKGLSWLNDTEVKAVASDLGVNEKVVREMEERMYGQDTAFDSAPETDTPSSHTATYQAPVNQLENKNADPAKLFEQSNWTHNTNNKLYKALSALDERSQVIIKKRWLNSKKTTLHELADEYGVSAERIRQLEKNSMQKIKHLFYMNTVNKSE